MVRILIYSEIQIPQVIFTPSLMTSSEEGNEGRGGPLSYLSPAFRPSSVSLVVPLYI